MSRKFSPACIVCFLQTAFFSVHLFWSLLPCQSFLRCQETPGYLFMIKAGGLKSSLEPLRPGEGLISCGAHSGAIPLG